MHPCSPTGPSIAITIATVCLIIIVAGAVSIVEAQRLHIHLIWLATSTSRLYDTSIRCNSSTTEARIPRIILFTTARRENWVRFANLRTLLKCFHLALQLEFFVQRSSILSSMDACSPEPLHRRHLPAARSPRPNHLAPRMLKLLRKRRVCFHQSVKRSSSHSIAISGDRRQVHLQRSPSWIFVEKSA